MQPRDQGLVHAGFQVTAAVDGALDTAKITDQTLYVEKRKVIDKVRSIDQRDGSAALWSESYIIYTSVS